MKFRTRLLIMSGAIVLLRSTGFSATFELQGLLNPNDTAIVSNPSLAGDIYSFTIQNTAPVGVIANLGISFGNTLRLSSFTTSAPFQYTVVNNTSAPDFNLPLDFAMAGQDQNGGYRTRPIGSLRLDLDPRRWSTDFRNFGSGCRRTPGCQISIGSDSKRNRCSGRRSSHPGTRNGYAYWN